MEKGTGGPRCGLTRQEVAEEISGLYHQSQSIMCNKR